MIGLLLRFGQGAEILTWGFIALLLPLSGIFYPVEALPAALQPIALALPTTHVFAAAQQVVAGNPLPWDQVGIAAASAARARRVRGVVPHAHARRVPQPGLHQPPRLTGCLSVGWNVEPQHVRSSVPTRRRMRAVGTSNRNMCGPAFQLTVDERASVVEGGAATLLLLLAVAALRVDPLRPRGSATDASGGAGRSTASPRAIFSLSRSSATSRLRACERESAAVARTTGPSRSSRRARCRGPSDVDASTSKRTSTRVSDVFACWPPGPPERDTSHSSSLRSMRHDGVTRSHRSSLTPP